MAHLRVAKDDEKRKAELAECFKHGVEVWMDQHDCELIGDFVTRLNYGERISSETNEIRYSSAWL